MSTSLVYKNRGFAMRPEFIVTHARMALALGQAIVNEELAYGAITKDDALDAIRNHLVAYGTNPDVTPDVIDAADICLPWVKKAFPYPRQRQPA